LTSSTLTLPLLTGFNCSIRASKLPPASRRDAIESSN
jgi:hypothetical protein